MEVDENSQTTAAIIFDQEREGAFGNDTISPNLVHYCSCEAAKSIIESRSVYFNVSSGMNDISEIRWAFEFIKIEFNKIKENDSRGYIILKNSLNLLNKNFNFNLETCFLFCLSEYACEDGSLSMWRAYGSDGNGCAIKFDGTALNSSPSSQFPISINKVHYLEIEELSQKVRILIANLIRQINLDYYIKSVENFELMISSKIFDLCASIKHPAFREENEIRLIYRHNYDTKPGRFPFRSVFIRGLSRPIVEVGMMNYEEFPGLELTMENILSGIIIGPSQHARLNELALRMSCMNAGIRPIPDNFFHQSRIPYRSPR
ncbi:MAG: DUF2971 domain-containing protein [Oceanicaulis sp.]|uniref:DUF2971 domain-containing protein n=1 Tax=Glycocaulis sp. TaxID=1969725 RepID=UPI0025BA60FB|nr:DUF2971 domain-containing protein [Glycocaulis sp.]MCC5981892.1 DUF2971 domain-containing protein [Oceanicaulis sp.]MCH8522798.1 DUF2971 domain-containing protein [Glycocaulis sp.]